MIRPAIEIEEGVSRPLWRNVVDVDLIEQGGVVGPAGIDADEVDGMAAGRHAERAGRVGGVARAGRGEWCPPPCRPPAPRPPRRCRRVVAPLGGADADLVSAGRREKSTAWLIVPLFWMKATWSACGALGLPLVKALPLPARPAVPLKLHDEAVGSYW